MEWEVDGKAINPTKPATYVGINHPVLSKKNIDRVNIFNSVNADKSEDFSSKMDSINIICSALSADEFCTDVKYSLSSKRKMDGLDEDILAKFTPFIEKLSSLTPDVFLESEGRRTKSELSESFADAVDCLRGLIEAARKQGARHAHGPTASFSQAIATSLTLPSKAPEIYAERTVRPELGRKENPIEFLNRVWGAYMAAGVLYQDDIKRLGDDKLVQAVRGRCRDENTDPATILPPPGKVRAARLAPSLAPDEAEAVYLMVARGKTAAKRIT